MGVKDKVYFAASSDRIKIGTTAKDVTERIAQINTHLVKPLHIIGFMAGGLPLERAIQKHLKAWRIKGEWFRNCDDVRKIIDRLIGLGPRAIGYAGDCYLTSATPLRGRATPSNPKAVGVVARLMWGDAAGEQLAALAEVDEATASRWIEDKTSMPRLAKYAFASIAMNYALGGETPSFTRAVERSAP